MFKFHIILLLKKKYAFALWFLVRNVKTCFDSNLNQSMAFFSISGVKGETCYNMFQSFGNNTNMF